MDEIVKRIQALARMAFVLSIGALMLGFIAFLLSWIAPSEDGKGVPLLLLAPGIALLLAGIILLVKALRSPADKWQDTYRTCVKVLGVIAVIAVAAIVLIAVIVAERSNIWQLILVALIGLQGPLALLATSRHMKRAVSA